LDGDCPDILIIGIDRDPYIGKIDLDFIRSLDDDDAFPLKILPSEIGGNVQVSASDLEVTVYCLIFRPLYRKQPLLDMVLDILFLIVTIILYCGLCGTKILARRIYLLCNISEFNSIQLLRERLQQQVLMSYILKQ
jgi:hypothetical protein